MTSFARQSRCSKTEQHFNSCSGLLENQQNDVASRPFRQPRPNSKVVLSHGHGEFLLLSFLCIIPLLARHLHLI
jgi:hypothetical protein